MPYRRLPRGGVQYAVGEIDRPDVTGPDSQSPTVEFGYRIYAAEHGAERHAGFFRARQLRSPTAAFQRQLRGGRHHLRQAAQRVEIPIQIALAVERPHLRGLSAVESIGGNEFEWRH